MYIPVIPRVMGPVFCCRNYRDLSRTGNRSECPWIGSNPAKSRPTIHAGALNSKENVDLNIGVDGQQSCLIALHPIATRYSLGSSVMPAGAGVFSSETDVVVN
jgi:hypothetical protein